MTSPDRTPDQIRAYLQQLLPTLKHWQPDATVKGK